MSDQQMSRPEFDQLLEEETITQLQGEITRYAGLISLANGYKRPDLAKVLAKVRAAFTVGISEVEALRNSRPQGSN